MVRDAFCMDVDEEDLEDCRTNYTDGNIISITKVMLEAMFNVLIFFAFYTFLLFLLSGILCACLGKKMETALGSGGRTDPNTQLVPDVPYYDGGDQSLSQPQNENYSSGELGGGDGGGFGYEDNSAEGDRR